MIAALSGPEFALYVIVIALTLIPLTIWATTDLVRQREARRVGRLVTQRRRIGR